MGCRYEYERMNNLQRCGCRCCEEEYYDMRRREARYYRPSLDYNPMPAPSYMIQSATISLKETKVEEPKNIAVKILVDRLKSEQSSLASNSASLKSYENQAKTYRENKNKNLLAIKELAGALKKLGHKAIEEK